MKVVVMFLVMSMRTTLVEVDDISQFGFLEAVCTGDAPASGNLPMAPARVSLGCPALRSAGCSATAERSRATAISEKLNSLPKGLTSADVGCTVNLVMTGTFPIALRGALRTLY